MKYITIVAMLFLPIISLFAQIRSQVKACVNEDGIVVRWAPNDMRSWEAGNSFGYIVERYTIMKDGDILSVEDIAAQKISTQPIMVKPLELWEPYADEKYVAIAAECLYGNGEVEKSAADAGVSPFLAYRRHKEKQQRFSFALFAADMSSKAAELLGLKFVDKQVDKQSKYLYKVFIAMSDTVAQDTAMVFVNAGIETPMTNIQAPYVVWLDKKADISLDLTYYSDAYTSYIIEHSADGGKTWSQVNDDPVISITPSDVNRNILHVTDILPDNNIMMQYRIYGIDCFGRKGPMSDVVEGHGVLPLSVTPQIVRSEVLDNSRVEIEWAFPDSLNSSVDGFRVYRQSGPNERLKKIMDGQDATQRKFVDNIPNMTNYYKVSAYNKETEQLMATVSYVGLIDSFPPMPPVELVGKIDTAGIATITWRGNSESDLAGYRVYSANSDKEEFSLLTPEILKNNIYKHKVNLNTLTHVIYYQVRAVDKRDNHSKPSEILKVIRPDTIAPVAPVFKSVEELRGKPVLTWLASSSDDVVKHVIERREEYKDTFVVVAEVAQNITEYLDKSVEDGVEYTYGVYAEDTSGNKSRKVLSEYVPTTKIKDELKLKVRTETNGNKLTWDIKTRREIKEYIIYREIEGKGMRPYNRTSGNSYIDKDVVVGKKYNYGVRIVYNDGSMSELF